MAKAKTICYRSKYTKEQIIQMLKGKTELFSKHHREFICEIKGDGEIFLGIERGSHAGYWYMAKLENDENMNCNISGHIEYGLNRLAAGDGNMFSMVITACILCLLLCIPILISMAISIFNREKTKEEYLDIFMTEYLDCEKISS